MKKHAPPSVSPRVKPSLRGVSHELAAYLSILSGGILLELTRRHVERYPQAAGVLWGNALYSICLTLLFGISAFYHRPTWRPRIRAVLRRLDHSAIYLLIAGTGTAVGVAAIQSAEGMRGAEYFLVVLWLGAALGILKSIFWINAPKPVSALAYALMGLSAVPFMPRLADGLGLGAIGLVLVGGALYLVGAATYALKRPDPWPQTFGYHEIFHLLVIGGAACHYAAIVGTVLG